MTLDDDLTVQQIDTLENGVLLDEKMTLPCSIKHLKGTRYTITLMEGRFHQIKRMIAIVSRDVIKLHRISIGPLTLDKALAEGEYRALSKEEVKKLFETTKTLM
jgi:16S rRNA pseudouridine516 synthase